MANNNSNAKFCVSLTSSLEVYHSLGRRIELTWLFIAAKTLISFAFNENNLATLACRLLND